MYLKRAEIPILVVNLVYIPVFTAIALTRFNFEFLLYAGVVVVVAAWILWKQRQVELEPPILWSLTIWGLLHMAGGNIPVGDGVLYDVRLIPVVLRYDQLTHAFGFGAATLVCHHLLRPHLKEGMSRWGTLAVLIVLMGCGVGALNEIIEGVAELVLEETGVGGYANTVYDLAFNLLGAVLAVGWLIRRERKRGRNS